MGVTKDYSKSQAIEGSELFVCNLEMTVGYRDKNYVFNIFT